MAIYETPLGKMKVAKYSERGTTRVVVHNGVAIAELSTRGASGSVLVSGRGQAFRAPSMAEACRQLANSITEGN